MEYSNDKSSHNLSFAELIKIYSKKLYPKKFCEKELNIALPSIETSNKVSNQLLLLKNNENFIESNFIDHTNNRSEELFFNHDLNDDQKKQIESKIKEYYSLNRKRKRDNILLQESLEDKKRKNLFINNINNYTIKNN